MFKYFIILIITCFTSLELHAKFPNDSSLRVNLDDLVEYTIINHPKIKNANASINKIKASKGEIWDIPSTDISFAWGQLNDIYRGDNQFEIYQSLGSLLTPFYKKKLYKHQLESGILYKDIVKKEIVAEVKIAWANYMHLYSIADIFKDHAMILKRLYEFATIENGIKDATQLEIHTLRALITDIDNSIKNADEDLNMALRKLKWACYINIDIQPIGDEIYFIKHNTNVKNINYDNFSNAYTEYQISLSNEKLADYRIEKSKYFPEISIAYARQKMAPLTGLNACLVGISIPIIFFPQQSRIKQAKIEYEISKNEEEYNKNEILFKLFELATNINRENILIDSYIESFNNADSIIKSIYAKLNDKINIMKFIQIIKNAEEVKTRNLENIYRYNLAAIEYELYSSDF